jgi:hypothetical protein
MKKTVLYLFLLPTYFCFGQVGDFFIEINYNNHSHSGLKKIQQEIIESVQEISLTSNDNFPGSIGYTVGFRITNFAASFFLGYDKTGGKVSYSDYSGVIKFEQELSSFILGGNFERNILNNKRSDFLFLKLKTAVRFSSLEIVSNSRILENTNQSFVDFDSKSIILGVGISYEYPLFFFRLRTSIGFDFDIGAEYAFKENSDYYLQNNANNKVKTDWSGLSSGIGITIPIK